MRQLLPSSPNPVSNLWHLACVAYVVPYLLSLEVGLFDYNFHILSLKNKLVVKTHQNPNTGLIKIFFYQLSLNSSLGTIIVIIINLCVYVHCLRHPLELEA